MCHISIIITNYNYANFLRTCIESCLRQEEFKDFEVILVDDGSSDGSIEIANQYSPHGLRIIQRKNGGIEAASNTGIDSAKGEYVVRVDADDYLLPHYLREMVPLLESGIGFTYSDYYVVDGSDIEQSIMRLPQFDIEELLSRGDFLATGTIYRKSTLAAYGNYTTDFPNCGLENYELILKMLQDGLKGKKVSQSLFCYRRHGGNISDARRAAIMDYGRTLFSRAGIRKFQTNQYHPYIAN